MISAGDLARYRDPSLWRSLFELSVTAVSLVLLWVLMWASLSVSYGLSLVLAVPAAAFLMRLFMLQHDCGHGALFGNRAANDWVGRSIGIVTLTPYGFWRRTHAIHHAAVGNLDKRGIGDIETLTVAEYSALDTGARRRYRIYRHPLVIFGLVPAYLFLLHYRLPVGLMRAGKAPWISTMGTNAAIATIVLGLIWLVGLGPFLLIQGPVILIAASLAMWFFYVQHQFEDTRWVHADGWKFQEAALQGSSHYELPAALAWFTGNIGVHHVHHLSSRIPFYRLSEVLADHPELAGVGRLTFLQSFRCANLALWDERDQKLVSFRQFAASEAARG